MNTKSLVGIVLGCAILIGGGYIVYTERPVMKLPQPQAEQKNGFSGATVGIGTAIIKSN
jgi:hypothetical protein